MLALGCDHGGYNLICAIKKYLVPAMTDAR